MSKVAQIEPEFEEREPDVRKIAVIKMVSVDPKNPATCFVNSWHNGETKNRCSGVSTILDSGDLSCKLFNEALQSEDDSQAKWGQSEPIVRCRQCLLGEAILNKK